MFTCTNAGRFLQCLVNIHTSTLQEMQNFLLQNILNEFSWLKSFNFPNLFQEILSNKYIYIYSSISVHIIRKFIISYRLKNFKINVFLREKYL